MDWCDQKRPEPLVVATNPVSSGPPQTLQFESGIPVTQEAATGPGYLSFALVVYDGDGSEVLLPRDDKNRPPQSRALCGGQVIVRSGTEGRITAGPRGGGPRAGGRRIGRSG